MNAVHNANELVTDASFSCRLVATAVRLVRVVNVATAFYRYSGSCGGHPFWVFVSGLTNVTSTFLLLRFVFVLVLAETLCPRLNCFILLFACYEI